MPHHWHIHVYPGLTQTCRSPGVFLLGFSETSPHSQCGSWMKPEIDKPRRKGSHLLFAPCLLFSTSWKLKCRNHNRCVVLFRFHRVYCGDGGGAMYEWIWEYRFVLTNDWGWVFLWLAKQYHCFGIKSGNPAQQWCQALLLLWDGKTRRWAPVVPLTMEACLLLFKLKVGIVDSFKPSCTRRNSGLTSSSQLQPVMG